MKNRARRAITLLTMLVPLFVGGCNLKEVFCVFLGDSCGDERPSENPALLPPPPPPAAVEAVFLTPPPSMVVAGEAWPDVVVELRNQFGQRTENDERITVELVHDGSGSFLGGFTGFTSDGRITLSGIVYQVAEEIDVTVMAEDLEMPASVAMVVAPAPADHLVISQAPMTPVVAGTTWPEVVVQVRDSFGNLTELDDELIELSLSDGTGTLGGTLGVSTSMGVAAFSDLTYDTSEMVELLAEASSPGIDSAGFSVDIDPAPAVELAFNIPDDATTQVNQPISVIAVDIVDEFGNRVLSAPDVTVSLALSGSGVLTAATGTTARVTTQGRAVFDDLSYDTVESISFTASAAGFDPVSVLNFTVQDGAPDNLGAMTVSLDEMGATIKGEEPDISADGRFVTFVAEVNGPGDVFDDIYRRDMETGASTLVLDDDEGASGGRDPRVSADGRLIAYGHGNPEDFLLDVSVLEKEGIPYSSYVALSSNGRYVVRQSNTSSYAELFDPWLGEHHIAAIF